MFMGQAPRGPKICRDLGQTLANIVKAMTPQAFNIKRNIFLFVSHPLQAGMKVSYSLFRELLLKGKA